MYFGLRSYGLYSYGLAGFDERLAYCRYGLRSHGLYSYGLAGFDEWLAERKHTAWYPVLMKILLEFKVHKKAPEKKHTHTFCREGSCVRDRILVMAY